MSSFNSFPKTVPTARSLQLRRELPGAKKGDQGRNRCGGREDQKNTEMSRGD